ncbi:hypothetical protein ACIQCJ_04520 [Streptomyces sp. NPDC093221]|uniref:hypothetical protein n=1 Tax=Streptomyces sp. NPDC093221 TaxID=3366032 RepID=UPI00381F43ED
MRAPRRAVVGASVLNILGVLGFLGVALLGAASPAVAGDGDPISPPPKPPTRQATSDNGSISAGVQLDTRHNGSGRSVPVSAVDRNWTPPLCWSQPKYDAEQYKDWALGPENVGIGPNAAQIAETVKKRTDFHEDAKGAWWFRTYDVDQMTSGSTTPGRVAACTSVPGQQWVDAVAPKPMLALSPQVLSGLAYKALLLPTPPVRLSPVADNQIVNVPTFASFTGALPDRVWVTASFDALGLTIAATTVAVPSALRIDAGTPYAEPQTCEYDLTPAAGGGYQVDSSKDACNVTYRKAGPYTLHAEITWKVTWTASANPNGPVAEPGLPDGLSGNDVAVVAKEVQTVVR